MAWPPLVSMKMASQSRIYSDDATVGPEVSMTLPMASLMICKVGP